QSMTLRDRRLTEADKARVAIAKGLLPLDANVSDRTLELPGNVPTDPPRTELVKGVLEHKDLNLIGALQKFGPLRPYFFGADVRGADEGGGKKAFADKILANYKAEDARTALADSIVKVVQSRDSDAPAAIVV